MKKAFPVKPIPEEPWVELADARALDGWGKEDNVRYNQMLRQTWKYNFYVAAFGFIEANEIQGDYLEFGCHRVRTFRMALTEARRQLLDGMRFFAFDSFQGLPPDADPQRAGVSTFQPRALTTTEEQFMDIVRAHGLFVDRVRTIKGFYAQSLKDSLRDDLLSQGVKAAMVTVDCDLYESAVPVFDFLDPFLQPGTIVYLDDVFAAYKGAPNRGVPAAFAEYQARSDWKFESYWPVLGSFGRAYVVYL